MKLLIVGNQGQLGRELELRGIAAGFELTGIDLPKLDLTRPDQVKAILEHSGAPLVVNAAAYTAVDKAESEPELAFAVNADGPRHLADQCHRLGLALIHVSTDYVFDGTATRPYLETDPISPIGVYGQSKADGEVAVSSRLSRHLILRTSWLYGLYGANFVKTMLRLGKQRQSLSVVADQQGCPTCAADLAEAILAVASRFSQGSPVVWGTYHYCGQGITTWHQFAETIFELARPLTDLCVTHVEAIATSAYPTAARRPAFSALDCQKIRQNFDIAARPWRESLAQTLKQILAANDR
jgi:dTDP-4-dehydrorhamnose reductase